MAVAVPGQRRHPVARLDAEPDQGVGQPADALARLGVAVAVQAALHGLRDHLHVGIDFGGVVDHARDQQRPVHHHPAQHGRILPGMLCSGRVTSRVSPRQAGLQAPSNRCRGQTRRVQPWPIVETQKQGDVAVIRMDNPPVNALGHALRAGLEKAFAEANADAGVKAIVLTGTGRFFSAGADITEFKVGDEGAVPAAADRQDRGRQPSRWSRPSTARRWAAGWSWRSAATTASRPRTCASWVCRRSSSASSRAPAARSGCRAPSASSRPCNSSPPAAFIDAAKGAAAGLIDKVADGDVVAAAVAFAKEQIGKPPRRIGEKKIDKASVPAGLFEKARAAHRAAPERAHRAARRPSMPSRRRPPCRSREGSARERQVFREAAASPYARALQYAFFAERQAANLPGIGPDAKLRDIKTVGILGAGTMGTGITLAFLNGGFPVTIVETTQEALDQGVDRIKDTLVGQRQARPHHRGAGRRPLGQADAVAQAGGPRQGRPHHRGRVREHGAEEGGVRQARQDRQIGRHHRHQHLDPRRRRDRRRDQAAAGRGRAALLLARQHHAAAGDRARGEDRATT